MYFDFTGKRVLITGGANGIGRAAADLFRDAGASTAILDLYCSREMLDGAHLEIPCDLSQSHALMRSFEKLWTKWDSLDVLVNNAGIEYTANVEHMPEEDWDRVFNVNLKSVFLCCKQSLPQLKRTRGSIVNTASQLAFVGVPGLTAYNSTKAAIVSFTRTLALETATDGIRVNCVCPGAIDTPMIRRQFTDRPGPQGSLDDLISLHPLGRLGTPEEIAACILFLSSPLASFITGSALIADGGYTIR